MVQPGDQLSVADDVTLPAAEVLTGRGFVTGKSGSGKSNTASVVAEELLALDARLLVVDTDGEYYGLKEEYELLHVGADEYCDVEVGPEDAETVADLVVAESVPVILDVSGFLEAEKADKLVYEVAKHVFSMAGDVRQPCLMLVEEVHEFVPEQGGLDDVGEMLVRVAKRGRKRGLGLCGLSQRPAAVDKDFITQCDWMAWHRLTWANDTRVVKRVLGAEYAEQIEYLDTGEAFLQTDWDGEIERVQFRRKRTHDAGATPGFGETADPDLTPVPDEWVAAFGDEPVWDRQPAPDANTDEEATDDEGDASLDSGGEQSTADAGGTASGEGSGGEADATNETSDTAGGTNSTTSTTSGSSRGSAAGSSGRSGGNTEPKTPPSDANHVVWELGQLVFYVVRETFRRTGAALRDLGRLVLAACRWVVQRTADGSRWTGRRAVAGGRWTVRRAASGLRRVGRGVRVGVRDGARRLMVSASSAWGKATAAWGRATGIGGTDSDWRRSDGVFSGSLANDRDDPPERSDGGGRVERPVADLVVGGLLVLVLAVAVVGALLLS